MSHPDRILIRAIIPHGNDPILHVVDSQGNYPSRTHEASNGTFEATFRTIGRDVLGRTLSVDRRRAELDENSQTITYQAKPIDHSFDLANDYSWAKRM